MSSTSLIVTGLALGLAGAVLVALGAMLWSKREIELRHVQVTGTVETAQPMIRKDMFSLWAARVGACLLVAGSR